VPNPEDDSMERRQREDERKRTKGKGKEKDPALEEKRTGKRII